MAALGNALSSDRGGIVRRVDWPLLAGAALLFVLGLASLYSVSHRYGEDYFKKQVAMGVLGLVPFGLFWLVRLEVWQRLAGWLYALAVVMLAAVLKFGSSANGAQRWIDLKVMQFQPSELAKLLMIIALAAFFSARRGKAMTASTVGLSLLLVGVPMLLIAKQPHYGGALVLLVIWGAVAIAAGVPSRYFVLLAALCAVGGVVAWKTPGLLHDYHIKRIRAMKTADKSGASYQQDRAAVAFAAGGLTGTGFLRGTQKLPEQQNDFVLTILGEETGLVGCGILLALYGFFFHRIWLVMVRAREPFHKLAAAGVLAVLAFHTVTNVGMVAGVLPVVGLWLPFMSAGGSSLWLCMACVGLLLNIRSKEKPLLFQ